jgi:cytochrome c oxidase cbb3-type subunit 3
MAGAQQLFVQRCAQCHGNSAEGNIGPNLTDDYWLHGNQLTDIYRTVMEGVTDKGMQSWKTVLRPGEILSVTAYVGSLRGSEPDRPKAPQGEHLPYEHVPGTPGEAEEGAAAAADEEA